MNSKYVIALMASLSALVLSACGGGGGSSNGTATATPATTPTAASAPTATTPASTPAATGLAVNYQNRILTGGGDIYADPVASLAKTSGFTTANQNQRGLVEGDFGGNGCPAILEAASYDTNGPQLPLAAWTSDCQAHFTLNTSGVISGVIPTTGFVTASFAGDFNKTGHDSVILIDSGLETPDANGNFPGAASNHLLLNEGGVLVDRSSTNLPSEGTNYNHVSTMYHLNVAGGQTLVLTRFGGQQYAGGGIELQVNDGTGNFVGEVSQLPPEIAYTATFDGTVDYVLPGTATMADLDSSGTPYLITGTYANGTYLSKQNAVFIYKQINGKYQRVATVPIPAAYANIPYSTGQPTAHLGVSSVTTGDFDGSGNADIAVLWEGQGLTRLQVIRNNGNDSFTDATAGVPAPDIINSQNSVVAGITNLHVADVDGDGKVELILQTYGAAALQSMNRSGWRPVMHMVNSVMQFEDVFGGADVNTIAGQLGVAVTDPITFMYGNFGTGKEDLLVSDWGASTTAGTFTVTNRRTFSVLLRR
jgi:hypothetical protein